MSQASILSCEEVTVAFDGFKAVQGMSLSLEPGELRFLIGPNGAGKTTMLDVICGKVKPVSGSVSFRSRAGVVDITKRKEHKIAELGIGRKFQTPSIFAGLTVMENLEIAMSQNRGVWATLRASLTRRESERIDEELALIGLGDHRHARAGLLSHGQKQWLEIGMMLLQEPEILLLDEPVAGMTDRETDKTGELLQEIVKRRTVVVVEHDMEFVRNFASKVTVMHEGKLLKDGTMDEIQSDDRVAEVYLGKRRDAHAVG
ncbi:urea ABC transporter ATP-binding protein UrtD [Cohnella sp. 56]|uniref:urea ABC transporter ATP-binding protein UrtD n=1 Tax=Cohnella sp. 56 TaxID=3113722 RepID=UPI0030E823DA